MKAYGHMDVTISGIVYVTLVLPIGYAYSTVPLLEYKHPDIEENIVLS